MPLSVDSEWSIFLSELFFFAIPIIGILSLTVLNLPIGACIIGSILGILIFPWLYWSYSITKWRIWAFENVRNVHDLKKQAINANLIWPDGSFFERTEIRTADDKYKLSQLESKFEQPDVFFDDYNIPDETVVKYSKFEKFFGYVIGVGMVFIGVYLLVTSQFSYVSVLLLAFGVIVCWSVSKKRTENPVIILNKKGMQTEKNDFFEWSEIQNDEIIKEGFDKHVRYYLVYYAKGINVKLDLAGLDMNRNKLEDLLRVYRVRYNNSKKA